MLTEGQFLQSGILSVSPKGGAKSQPEDDAAAEALAAFSAFVDAEGTGESSVVEKIVSEPSSREGVDHDMPLPTPIAKFDQYLQSFELSERPKGDVVPNGERVAIDGQIEQTPIDRDRPSEDQAATAPEVRSSKPTISNADEAMDEWFVAGKSDLPDDEIFAVPAPFESQAQAIGDRARLDVADPGSQEAKQNQEFSKFQNDLTEFHPGKSVVTLEEINQPEQRVRSTENLDTRAAPELRKDGGGEPRVEAGNSPIKSRETPDVPTIESKSTPKQASPQVVVGSGPDPRQTTDWRTGEVIAPKVQSLAKPEGNRAELRPETRFAGTTRAQQNIVLDVAVVKAKKFGAPATENAPGAAKSGSPSLALADDAGRQGPVSTAVTQYATSPMPTSNLSNPSVGSEQFTSRVNHVNPAQILRAEIPIRNAQLSPAFAQFSGAKVQQINIQPLAITQNDEVSAVGFNASELAETVVSVSASGTVTTAPREVSALLPAPQAGVQTTPPPISVQIAQAIAAADGPQIEVKLSPEELGSVRIVMATREAGMHVTIYADRAETLELLKRDEQSFSADLNSMGFSQSGMSFEQEPSDNTREGRDAEIELSAIETKPVRKPQVWQLGSASMDIRL